MNRESPRSTYRLQMHAGFNLDDAREIVDYLAELGISHAYTSSLLAAKPGSTHGYDVVDHGRLNPEIGTEEQLRSWVGDLRRRGLGLIVDTVPNHMSVGAGNEWWLDVLENGPSSPYAEFFDIAWQEHPREHLRNRVLLPILGVRYGDAVDGGQFRLGFDLGAFSFDLNGQRLPVDPRTYDAILGPAADGARAAIGSDDAAVQKLVSVLAAVRHLPRREETDAQRREDGRAEIAVIKRRLATLAAPVAAFVQQEVDRINADPPRIDALIEAQAYRPCDWRVASDEINYRRFFDVNDLAALAAERDDVFRATHQKLLDWIADGLVDGLRIDHPDGLFDPKAYLRRLQDAVGRPLFVVVEKILGNGEKLPADWATDGTTGYEFAAVAAGLLVDPHAEAALTANYRAFAGTGDSFEEIAYRKKFLVMQSSLTSELHTLAGHLDRLAQSHRWSRDFTLNGLRHALREVIASFPIYRTYIDGEVTTSDTAAVRLAVARAARRNPLLGRAVFQFVRDTLLLQDPPTGPATPEYRTDQIRFAGKFQQLTSPVMAKGVEDTSFYIYNRLVALNEVGSDPKQFGRSPDRVHQFFAERGPKAGLSALSTHDTKRSEDVRARIAVLSEIPDEWAATAERWADFNRPLRTGTDADPIPDANDEYLLYQTLVGTWPASGELARDYADRLAAYMLKAAREAKVHTSWINPDSDYEAALEAYVRAVLDPRANAEFHADATAFVRDRIAIPGTVNSLAQVVLRSTAPGIPDVYQGTELWDDSLVDPDNRRPVDYAFRHRLLRELDSREAKDRAGLLRDLTARPGDHRLKLFVVSRTLRLRRDRDSLFRGEYVPLSTTGPLADHAFAFARTAGSEACIVVVPRLMARLTGGGRLPLGSEIWGDTAVELPETLCNRGWADHLTGEVYGGRAGSLRVAALLGSIPVAVLMSR